MNMMGITLDIVGAWFVAFEVVNQFRGKQHESSISSGPIGGIPTNDPPVETEEYKSWSLSK
jgi:hypothetical protein